MSKSFHYILAMLYLMTAGCNQASLNEDSLTVLAQLRTSFGEEKEGHLVRGRSLLFQIHRAVSDRGYRPEDLRLFEKTIESYHLYESIDSLIQQNETQLNIDSVITSLTSYYETKGIDTYTDPSLLGPFETYTLREYPSGYFSSEHLEMELAKSMVDVSVHYAQRVRERWGFSMVNLLIKEKSDSVQLLLASESFRDLMITDLTVSKQYADSIELDRIPPWTKLVISDDLKSIVEVKYIDRSGNEITRSFSEFSKMRMYRD